MKKDKFMGYLYSDTEYGPPIATEDIKLKMGKRYRFDKIKSNSEVEYRWVIWEKGDAS